jgi:poly(3-hydroxybutyrate) depolymerase
MQGALVFDQAHRGNRLGPVQDIRLEGSVLSLRSPQPGEAVLVLRSDRPLAVEACQGAEAVLRPGWDGTLGYSLYGLHLRVPAAGALEVRLRQTPPPAAPVPTTPEEAARFEREFAARASRSPDGLPAFQAWQAAQRRRLLDVFLGGALPERGPLEARILATRDYPVFQLVRVEYRSLPDRTNQLLLSLPKGVERAPLLLALHGHEADWGQAVEAAYTAGHTDDFIAHFAERGWAVLQPATMDHTLQHREWTLLGERTWDAMRALDYGLTLPQVDPERVAVCGLSTGAHLTMNLLALDQRIRAGVVGCILSTWHHVGTRFRMPPHCDCGVMAQLSPAMELCDWAAIAAPKPVQYQQGRQDVCFCPGGDPAKLSLEWNTGVMPEREYEVMFAEVQRAYRLLDRPDHLESLIHGGPHKVDNEAAFAWLNRWLGPAE